MKNRYFLYLSYKGTNYCGWQRQPNGISVQEKLEIALQTLLRHQTPVTGAGRTDAGVHARTMVAHFDAENAIGDIDKMVFAMNGILPDDIAIQKIVPVADHAHARFDALSRLYRYYIITKKDPFRVNTHYRISRPLDVERMNRCSQVLFEYKDFTSFSKLHTDVKTNHCDMMVAGWTEHDGEYIFTIKANRFLRNMVRAVVGTLVDAGKGKLHEDGVRAIIEAMDRGRAGASVPAHGLFLEEIEYPDTIFV